jgi:hypothetical protein
MVKLSKTCLFVALVQSLQTSDGLAHQVGHQRFFLYTQYFIIRWTVQRCVVLATGFVKGKRWRSWLRHCVTSRKVAGSTGTGIFNWRDPSDRTTALGSFRPLTESSTRNISWRVKAAGAYGWQPCHLHMLIVLKSFTLNLLEPSWSTFVFFFFLQLSLSKP